MVAGIYEKMSQAKSVSGRAKWRQLIGIFRLFFERWRLGPSALHEFGLPHPEIYAVTHPFGRHSGLAPCFSGAESLADILRRGMRYPFFSIPIFGNVGSSAYGYQRIFRLGNLYT